MTCAPAIYARLIADGPTNTAVAGRIFPRIAPEVGRAFPAIVYETDAAQVERGYDGGAGLATQTVRVACMDYTNANASAIAQDVFAALDDQAFVAAGINVQGAFLETQNESTEQTDGLGDDALIYVIELEFSVAFNI